MKLVGGCNLGKATASFAIISKDANGEVKLVKLRSVAHEGQPIAAFRKWYAEEGLNEVEVLAVTGIYADEIKSPAVILPEDSCQEAAFELHPEIEGPLNLVSVGARGYSVLSRTENKGQSSNQDYRYSYLENDKCSSGTGENMVKIAGRFGMSIEEADNAALQATDSIPVTARCSVFAKSEMTHFANQGKPTSNLFRGYFESVARNVVALLARNRADGPVYLTGGVTRIQSFLDAFQTALDDEVRVMPNALALEAIGAALLASERQQTHTLPVNADDLIEPARNRFAPLEPASRWQGRVTMMPQEPYRRNAAKKAAVLGLDLGSTGSKAVLSSIEDGEAIMDVYDRTRGNPVDATRRLIKTILDNSEVDVRAIGITGSGREAVATFLRAVFPEAIDRIIVVNEIVAHATAAIRCDRDGGKDLSIIEIGGQDAKYIQVSGGKIVESDMNKACSAGTGSFLEEQAVFYGINEIDRFVALAKQADNPPNLGQMCTVFVADAANEALKEGYEIADIFGGFQYSIIQNYINRVMGQRTLASTIFFQGKPATNPSLAWTLAAVTKRDVVVPPNPGAMGAWGIGLCAIDQLQKEQLGEYAGLRLADTLTTEIVGRSEFRCKDAKCQTYCPIERTTVSVNGKETTMVSGGACPKYEISTGTSFKLEKDAPDPFVHREDLIYSYLTPQRQPKGTIALPRAGVLDGILPWMITFVQEMGFEAKVLSSQKDSLARGEQLCYSYDACGPVKLAHAICDSDSETLFFPKVLTVRYDGSNGSPGRTCSMEQGLPDMIAESLADMGSNTQVVRPVLSFAKGYGSEEIITKLRSIAKELGADIRRVRNAVKAAARAQQEFESSLYRAGNEAMAYAREYGAPIVLLCGSLHVIHDNGVNAGIPQLIRKNGAMVIPMDCFAIEDGISDMDAIYWADANKITRAAAAARREDDVFPLLLTSFGCGPGSMIEPVFSEILEDYPYTILETDGHGGSAGYVTRVQAFLYTARQYGQAESQVAEDHIFTSPHYLCEGEPEPITMDHNTRYVLFSIADNLMPIIAASFRSMGYDVVPAPPSSARTLDLGKSDCSGKECLPYQLIWGSFREFLEDNPSDKKTVLLQVTGETACRNGMFRIKDNITLRKMKLDNVSIGRFVPFSNPLYSSKLWAGLVAWDLIKTLYAYHLAIESEKGSAQRLYDEYCAKILAIIEKPAQQDFTAPMHIALDWLALKRLLKEASLAFTENSIAGAADTTKTVLLSGDIYLRQDEFSNDGMLERLAEQNLKVLVEPVCITGEYFAEIRSSDLFGLPTDFWGHMLYKNAIQFIRNELYSVVQEEHSWLPQPDVPAFLAESEQHLKGVPRGEAPVTVGSVLHHYKEKYCDGAVLVSPWGCGPALISESILRHQKDIPMLFLYSDGTPIDDRRVKSFAFRLHQSQEAREEVFL